MLGRGLVTTNNRCSIPSIDHLSLNVDPIFGKSIMNKFICLFDRMENSWFMQVCIDNNV